MKKAFLIYNPNSGRQKVKNKLPKIIEKLEKGGYTVTAYPTKSKNDATLASKQACQEKYDLLIAAGGDGTIFEVVNGIANQPYRPTLGIIPGGTMNDFASSLNIPRNILKAVDVILKEKVVPIDVGKTNDKYFINVAAAGILTEVTYQAPSKLKKAFGFIAYYLKGIRKLPFMSSYNIKIEFDNQVYQNDIMLFLICNTKKVAGFDHISSKAKVDDGKFDLIIIEKMQIPRLLNLGILTLSGKHLKHAKVKYYQASKIKITTNNDIPLNLDGEYGGRFPQEFINLKQHLKVLSNQKE